MNDVGHVLTFNTTHLTGQVQYVQVGTAKGETLHKDANKFHSMKAGDYGIGACGSMVLTSGSHLEYPVRFIRETADQKSTLVFLFRQFSATKLALGGSWNDCILKKAIYHH